MTIKKLKMHSADFVQQKIEQIRVICPEAIVETRDSETGALRLSVDFDLLRQDLSDVLVKGPDERFRLDWPGKRESMLLANAPIAKTLRPCREESVDFDATQNLFIEGDNLDALKLLQETYLGKVKMIYIDPPYNTGNDFIYKDDFKQSTNDYLRDSEQIDEDGNRLVANPESKGRYHSDWLSMMAPRLRLARNLLRDDGVIFISIDDGEVSHLRKIADEVYGKENFRNTLVVRRRVKSLNSQFAHTGLQSLNIGFEYVLIYSKTSTFLMSAIEQRKKNAPSKGVWNVFWSNADRPTMRYELLGFTPDTGQWRWQKSKALEAVHNYNEYLENYSATHTLEEYWIKTGKSLRFIRRITDGVGKNGGVQHWNPPRQSMLRSTNWLDLEASQIHKTHQLHFSNPKNELLLQEIIKLSCNRHSADDIILDFFAGSSTTAHAVLKLNAEDGGNRKFIMVQLPEEIDPQSEAGKAGYATIADLSKERIRRAAREIKGGGELHPDWRQDVGFRVLKVDSSNMKDVYYRPSETVQQDLTDLTDNVKEDRTEEDLLFQVLLDWGVDLTYPIHRETVLEQTVFTVGDQDLVACFSLSITEELIKVLAERTPLRIVFRDAGFASDAVKINVQQILRQISPTTELKVL